MKFNEAQKTALSHKTGPMMVLAGPGSGKTTVITHRIAGLLGAGVRPSEILVITFTKASAREMEERFYSLRPAVRENDTESGRVTFGTFHSVFYRILKLAYRFPAGCVLGEEEKRQYFREFLENSELEVEDEGEFISAVINEISYVKGSQMDLSCYYSQNCPEEWFKRLYTGYEDMLRARGKLDFDDMLVMCYELFSQRKDILSAWQRKFRYILVDEFQDINQIQYEIVKMLALPENNLFIVGDDDQSIYRFRGARPELMLGFEKDYPDAERILLDVNYRCVDPVIESAGKLIANNKTRFQKEIHGNRGKGCPVFVKEWPDPLAETKAITEELRDYHQMGIAYEDMAVLYRTNQGPRLLIERMMEYNIPFHMRDTVPNLYEHWISRNVFCYIYAALGDLSRSNILQIINRPARYISRDALDTKVIRWEQLRSFYQDKNWMLDRIDQLVYDLEMLREMAPAGAVNYIRKAIGYDDYLREYANERRLKPEDLFEVLDALQESAVPFKTYEAWFNHMDEYKEQLKEQSALREAEKEGVSLMTMHSCKGLEFKVVYILDTNEGITPHHKAVLEPDLEEERRMFYVAMTRAKDRLHIFYVKERYHKRQTVSRFVVETGLLGKKGDLEKNGKQGRK